VLVFQSKLFRQQARDSVLDAKFAIAGFTAQNGVQHSIRGAFEFMGYHQFTMVLDTAKQGDHIPGELMGHQVTFNGKR
jgi:hypothetical protein